MLVKGLHRSAGALSHVCPCACFSIIIACARAGCFSFRCLTLFSQGACKEVARKTCVTRQDLTSVCVSVTPAGGGAHVAGRVRAAGGGGGGARNGRRAQRQHQRRRRGTAALRDVRRLATGPAMNKSGRTVLCACRQWGLGDRRGFCISAAAQWLQEDFATCALRCGGLKCCLSRPARKSSVKLCRVADRAMRSLHEVFETVLQFLEVAAAEPERLASPLALAAVRTLGRCARIYFLTTSCLH